MSPTIARYRNYFIYSVVAIAIAVVAIYIATPSAENKERFLALAKRAAESQTNVIYASELGDQLCLVEEVTFAPEILVRKEFPAYRLDTREFVDQSVGYWTLAIVNTQSKTIALISINQSEIRWRWIDPAERDEKRRQQELVCLNALSVAQRGRLEILD